MTFHRKKGSIVFHYQIEGTPIERVFMIRDLGVLYDVKLSFVQHIDLVILIALLMLGFIVQICSEFKDRLVLK